MTKISVFSSIILILWAITWQVDSSLFREKPNPKRKENGCYSDQYSLGHLPVGETKTVPGHCLRYSCENHGGIVYASCGTSIVNHRDYELTAADLSKPYPDCCPQFKPRG